uniref:Methyltransferase type 11 domain-containing protein n=1 Tax=Haptolina brevifila TaxID=156173 RepID=A0A7S2E476_9EUKA
MASLTIALATVAPYLTGDEPSWLASEDPLWAEQFGDDGVFDSSQFGTTSKRELEVDKISELLDLRPGMTYCEVGAANGVWATAIARKVMPGGQIVATVGTEEEKPAFLDAAELAGIPASVARGTELESGLPQDESCDVIFSRMSFFFIERPDLYALQFFAALKPGGKMLITDHGPMEGVYTGSRGIASFMKVTMATEQADFEAAGFRLLDQMDWKQYFSMGFANLMTKD